MSRRKAPASTPPNAQRRLLVFTPHAWEDYTQWKRTDAKTSARIDALLAETLRSPFTGTGKPEPLRGELSGKWSRRINSSDRMVYAVDAGNLYIIALKRHYT